MYIYIYIYMYICIYIYIYIYIYDIMSFQFELLETLRNTSGLQLQYSGRLILQIHKYKEIQIKL